MKFLSCTFLIFLVIPVLSEEKGRLDREEFDFRLGLSDEIPSIDITLQTHDLNIDFESNKSGSLSWKTGLKVNFQDNYSDPETGVKRLIPDYLRSEIGGYFLTSFVPSNLFQLEFGLRYDYDYISAKKSVSYTHLTLPTIYSV